MKTVNTTQTKNGALSSAAAHASHQLTELPNNASHCAQSACDLPIIYKGVVVQWDEDHDERVLGVLDEMPESIRRELIVVQEHEGGIAFIWRDCLPARYQEYQDDGLDTGIIAPDGDYWAINSSIAVSTKNDPYPARAMFNFADDGFESLRCPFCSDDDINIPHLISARAVRGIYGSSSGAALVAEYLCESYHHWRLVTNDHSAGTYPWIERLTDLDEDGYLRMRAAS
jgi:hypothetical protein